MGIIEIVKQFGTQEECISYLESLKWGNIPTCPYCQSQRSSKRKNEFRHHCQECNRSYSVLVGTIMESTKVPLPKWFAAIALILNAKKGISSLQLSRDLGINKNTAWYLQKRIRQVMGDDDLFLTGIIEADETYIGGSLVNKHDKEKASKQYHKTGMNHKTPALGMVERNGKIIVKVLNKAWGKEIKPMLRKSVDLKSVIVTDGFGGYKDLDQSFKKHVVLNHSKKVRKVGEYHTNTIEGFWSMLKRAILGQYHKITHRYLQNYINEMAFKYNIRNEENPFELLINKALRKVHV